MMTWHQSNKYCIRCKWNKAYIRLRPQCAIAPAQFSLNSIYFLNLSPINAKLTSLCRRTVEPRTQATPTKNLVKIAHVVPEISSQTDRRTQTDLLITVLCNHGWSNNLVQYQCALIININCAVCILT